MARCGTENHEANRGMDWEERGTIVLMENVFSSSGTSSFPSEDWAGNLRRSRGNGHSRNIGDRLPVFFPRDGLLARADGWVIVLGWWGEWTLGAAASRFSREPGPADGKLTPIGSRQRGVRGVFERSDARWVSRILTRARAGPAPG